MPFSPFREVGEISHTHHPRNTGQNWKNTARSNRMVVKDIDLLANRTQWDSDVAALGRFEDFQTTDWLHDNLLYHKRRSKTSPSSTVTSSIPDSSRIWSIYESIQTYVILTIVGICIGTTAAVLNVMTEYLSNIRTGYCTTALYLNRNFCTWGELDEHQATTWVEYSRFGVLNYAMFITISLVLALTSSKLVMHYAPLAAGSGISEIKCIASGFTLKKFLSFATYSLKSIGLPLAIASGLSVGKEGPSVHYAVCIGSVISKLFARKVLKTHQKNVWFRNILVAASGAGVAVAFGSPMGGVLFSVEEISNMFKLSTMWESYYCSLIAVATLQFFDPFRTGQVVLFEVIFDQDWHFFEIPIYIILGIFGGIYGIVVAKFNIKAVSFRKKYLGQRYLKEVAVLAIITASISYFNDFLRMDMTESMQFLFQECDEHPHHNICNLESKPEAAKAIFSLLWATVLRMIFTVFTYGCKVPAGIFVPSMATGATFGRALGIIFQLWRQNNPESSYFTSGCLVDNKQCITPGVYAFLGAGACLSGITHLTVCVVVIMFELTGALKYIIPTMITVATTKIINDKWGKGGIADQMIVFNGLPFIDPHEEHNFFGHPVSDAMTIKVVSLPLQGVTYGQLMAILKETDFQHFPIIQSASKPLIKGYIRREDLINVIERFAGDPLTDTPCIFDNDSLSEDDILNFTDAVNTAPLTVNVHVPTEHVLDIFHKLGPGCLLVESDGLLQGLITRKDVLKYEYVLHHIDHDESIRIREQTFKYQEQAWEFISRIENSLMDKVYMVRNRLFKRRYSRI